MNTLSLISFIHPPYVHENTPTNKYLQSKGGHAWGVRATSNSQAFGYIEKYGEFKAKGISEIHIITVNDRFVTKCVLCSCLRARTARLALQQEQ